MFKTRFGTLLNKNIVLVMSHYGYLASDKMTSRTSPIDMIDVRLASVEAVESDTLHGSERNGHQLKVRTTKSIFSINLLVFEKIGKRITVKLQ